MEKWKPINYKGSWNTDPRRELEARAHNALNGHDDWVAIPVKLAFACAAFLECSSRTTITADEDGPLPDPLEISCRKNFDHISMGDKKHGNRFISWD
ncbi:MAG TPA: hypothetical protein VLH19_04035 [Patescibacteria group bacterium]|nr:hypothetical protein [Patescibacteria group bacterium]